MSSWWWLASWVGPKPPSVILKASSKPIATKAMPTSGASESAKAGKAKAAAQSTYFTGLHLVTLKEQVGLQLQVQLRLQLRRIPTTATSWWPSTIGSRNDPNRPQVQPFQFLANSLHLHLYKPDRDVRLLTTEKDHDSSPNKKLGVTNGWLQRCCFFWFHPAKRKTIPNLTEYFQAGIILMTWNFGFCVL